VTVHPCNRNHPGAQPKQTPSPLWGRGPGWGGR